MATTLFFYWASWRAVVAVGRMRPRMQAYIKGQGLYGPASLVVYGVSLN